MEKIVLKPAKPKSIIVNQNIGLVNDKESREPLYIVR